MVSGASGIICFINYNTEQNKDVLLHMLCMIYCPRLVLVLYVRVVQFVQSAGGFSPHFKAIYHLQEPFEELALQL